MSWQERIKNDFVITTGDGNSYYPLWRGATKELVFNTEGFDFVGVEGTYVAREQTQGTKFPLEFYFEGENHIDIAKAFEISSRNKNAWVISHPIWGEITCQPLSLTFDSSAVNITKVTGEVWESIEVKYPDYSYNERNQVDLKIIVMITEAWYINPSSLSESSKLSAFSLNDLIDINYSKLPATNEQAVKLKNQIREVASAIEELLITPTRYMESFYSLLTFVIEVEDNIVSKINALRKCFNDCVSIGDVSIFEPTANAITSLACDVAIKNKYLKRGDIAEVSSIILEMYNNTNTFYEQNGIVPNYELSLAMDFIVNITIGNLYQVGMEASQERSLFLEKDSNAIVLAHRFYGLSDNSLDRFIEENNISINEMLQVKKGRKLIWYV